MYIILDKLIIIFKNISTWYLIQFSLINIFSPWIKFLIKENVIFILYLHMGGVVKKIIKERKHRETLIFVFQGYNKQNSL